MTNQPQMDRRELLELASDPKTTPFDYVIVGSGAGGGPLAARLALGDRRVLVLEAGIDPATQDGNLPPTPAETATTENLREVYTVPGYHAAATEDPPMTWDFSVRHYDSDKRQRQDNKYDAKHDPSVNGGKGKGGIQYPRASALGGCTAHYAMIIIRPNDADWDRMAELTNDASWRSENMQGYFAKIEQCLYYAVYKGFAGKILGWFLHAIQWVAKWLNPRRQLDPGGHGFKGWQPTSFIDPLVILGIVFRDRTFLGVLRDVLFSALANKDDRSLIKRAFSHLQIIQFLDPNVRSPEIPTRTHLSLISIGTDGKRRKGLRDHLIDVARDLPQRLVIVTETHTTRILFAKGKENATPRAIGVEVAEGRHLYRASPLAARATSARRQYFARHEVIVCGGAFNTPQLLMLSGIGDRKQLTDLGIKGLCDCAGAELAPVVDLPGVGANLQDRYEVSVISDAKADFSTLNGVSFVPNDPNDPARAQWLKDGTGLYSTNGGALAMMMSSKQNAAVRKEPDLFIFGVSAAFRGYYWEWSKELLRRLKGAKTDVRNLWTWVILKAYTRNNHGTVRLRSADPFDTPEINFHSFDEGNADYRKDVDALCEAVKSVRKINATIKVLKVKDEVQPGSTLEDDSDALADWVQNEAWGHHACGTCRIGPDQWQADVGKLKDRGAVLDSKFRVHGVKGLRVVDASVFPEIPGYFIVTPIFMVAEKAADTLLADSVNYPVELEHVEASAIYARRKIANDRAIPTGQEIAKLPDDTVGLALSGGGIRSATFCLGVLQALAARDKLRRIDIVSSVSGGGYIAGFLGRLYTRMSDHVPDKPARVSSILANVGSPEIWWLRRQANYIGSGGRSDLETNLAIFSRNLAIVHLCVGALLFAVFGLLCWIRAYFFSDYKVPWQLFGAELSFWWWLPLAILFIGVIPLAIGYWLAPGTSRRYSLAPIINPRYWRALATNPRRWLVLSANPRYWRAPSADPLQSYPIFPLILWLALLGSAVYALAVPGAGGWAGLAIGVLLIAWLAQEASRWRIAIDTSIAWGRPTAPPDNVVHVVPSSLIVRNRMTRALGVMLLALAVSLGWVVLDSLAILATSLDQMRITGWAMVVLAPLLPLLRNLAVGLVHGTPRDPAAKVPEWKRQSIIGGFAFVLAALLLFFLDVLAHWAFDASLLIGTWLVATVLVASALVGRAFPFINLSSLQQSYSQKLVRAFLGATNDARVHPAGTDGPVPVEIPDADDDVSFGAYHPEQNGGPLHLVNVCVNDTVDKVSGRQLQKDKGLPMCVGPAGVSVGLRFHALWGPKIRKLSANEVRVTPLTVAPDPNQFHVLARSDDKPVVVEHLRLGQWMAISGASFTTGAGRLTNIRQSLLLGLLNVRLGYWWNSGINAYKRPARYAPNPWRRLKSIPGAVFRVQATLLNEWRAYFAGPSARLWYLSDGGHFDNTGLYELIRRRLPFIIAVDGAQDQDYELEDLAIVTRQVRMDFGAELAWVDPTTVRENEKTDRPALESASAETAVPEWMKSYFDPNAIGALTALKRDGAHCAALARVTYADDSTKITWILLLKASLAPNIPNDVRNYATTHKEFPNQSTFNQFFDDDQWESYRSLGQCLASAVFLCPRKRSEPS